MNRIPVSREIESRLISQTENTLPHNLAKECYKIIPTIQDEMALCELRGNEMSEIERLRKALSYYANRDNWTPGTTVFDPEYIPAEATGSRMSGFYFPWEIAEHALTPVISTDTPVVGTESETL